MPVAGTEPTGVGAALARALGAKPNALIAPSGAAPPATAEVSSAASRGAEGVAYGCLALALAMAIVIKGKGAAFVPKEGFILFTGFYVAAQAVERLLEFVLPPGRGTPKAKADRTVIARSVSAALLAGSMSSSRVS
jgi:hypothetical protein